MVARCLHYRSPMNTMNAEMIDITNELVDGADLFVEQLDDEGTMFSLSAIYRGRVVAVATDVDAKAFGFARKLLGEHGGRRMVRKGSRFVAFA